LTLRRPQPSRRKPPPLLLALVLLLSLAGCGSRFGQPPSITEEGSHTLTLWRGFFIAACAVGGLVLGLILFAAVRFRRRSDDIPNQRPYNIPWEIAYTVTPVVVVAILFGFSVSTQGKVDRTVAQPALTVDVVGFQWGWQFHYPDRDVTITGTSEAGEQPTLVLPVGETTRLVLKTVDVNHSFWVPAFLQKRDLIQGVDNAIDVTPTTVGSFDGKCAEFCGLDHWRMPFTIRVVTQGEFDAWARSQPRSGS
jgi:cytochrome c oxidase subunit 2